MIAFVSANSCQFLTGGVAPRTQSPSHHLIGRQFQVRTMGSASSSSPIESMISHQFDLKAAGSLFVAADKNRFFAPAIHEEPAPGLILNETNPLKKVFLPFFLVNATTCTTNYKAEYGIEHITWYTDSEGKVRTRSYTEWYSIWGTVGPFAYTPDTNDMQIYAGFQWPVSHVEEAIAGHRLTQILSRYDPTSIDAETVVDPFLKRLSRAHDSAVQRIHNSLEYHIRADIYNRTGSRNISSISFNHSISSLNLLAAILPAYVLQYPNMPARFMAAISANPKVVGPAPLSESKVVIVSTIVTGVASLFFPATIGARVLMMIAGGVVSDVWVRHRLNVGYIWSQQEIKNNRQENDAVLETEQDRMLREATVGNAGSSEVAGEGRVLDVDPIYFVALGLNPEQPITEKEINKAFHKKINVCHPDKAGTHRQAIQVIAARNALLDAFKKSTPFGGKRHYSHFAPNSEAEMSLAAQFAKMKLG
jgi:hypothetical protein